MNLSSIYSSLPTTKSKQKVGLIWKEEKFYDN